jgi:hypothetical protein
MKVIQLMETVYRQLTLNFLCIKSVVLTLVSVIASPGEAMTTFALQLFILRVCWGIFALNCLLETKLFVEVFWLLAVKGAQNARKIENS